MTADQAIVDTDIPARLDRLPWGRFHTLVVAALGITWILDGLEVTLAGACAGALKAEPGAAFQQYRCRAGQQRLSRRRGARRAPLRLAHRPARPQEAVLRHADRLSRRHRGDGDVVEYRELRAVSFLTGAGIGGEYAAINSTIQELIPARVRGWTDLVINGSFWIGAAIGALGSLVLLDPAVIDPEHRLAARLSDRRRLAWSIFFMRLWIPESPRWLMTHGRAEEARAGDRGHRSALRGLPPAQDLPRVRLRMRAFDAVVAKLRKRCSIVIASARWSA